MDTDPARKAPLEDPIVSPLQAKADSGNLSTAIAATAFVISGLVSAGCAHKPALEPSYPSEPAPPHAVTSESQPHSPDQKPLKPQSPPVLLFKFPGYLERINGAKVEIQQSSSKQLTGPGEFVTPGSSPSPLRTKTKAAETRVKLPFEALSASVVTSPKVPFEQKHGSEHQAPESGSALAFAFAVDAPVLNLDFGGGRNVLGFVYAAAEVGVVQPGEKRFFNTGFGVGGEILIGNTVGLVIEGGVLIEVEDDHAGVKLLGSYGGKLFPVALSGKGVRWYGGANCVTGLTACTLNLETGLAFTIGHPSAPFSFNMGKKPNSGKRETH